MPFNNPDKPKILRTQLTEEVLRDFKILSVKLNTTMAELIEEMIIDRLREEEGELFDKK